MDHDDIFFKCHPLAVLLIGCQEGFLSLAGELVASSVQRIVKGLSDLEEIIATGNYVPMGGDVELGH